MARKELDKESTGISFHDHVFMVDGYLDDYALCTGHSPNVLDLIDNKGYTDSKGYVWIFKEKVPDKSSVFGIIPWFTIEKSKDVYRLHFSKRQLKDVSNAFRIENVGDISYKKIANSLRPNEQLYDEDVLNDLNSATSVFRPEIKEEDDFLKRAIKKIILMKEVNIAKYIPKVPKKYILSNWKQGLMNDSKTSALNFVNWMEIMGIKFHLIMEDNGTDTDPLREVLIYDNYTDKIQTISKEDWEEIQKILSKKKRK